MLVFAVVVLGVYALVAVSPYPTRLARSHPGLASLFRPPLFNFSAKYSDGSVLDFTVGQSRSDFEAALLHPTGQSPRIGAACGRPSGAPPLTAAESFVVPAATPEVSQILARDIVCLFYSNPSAVLFVRFSAEAVETIELTVVRTEGM
jgi:hypothetical protein